MILVSQLSCMRTSPSSSPLTSAPPFRSCYSRPILILVIGIGAGIVAALKPGRMDRSILDRDGVISSDSVLRGHHALLLTVFVLGLGWFPSGGDGFGLRRHHPPPHTPCCCSWFLLPRHCGSHFTSAVREELGREHVQTATSRGLPPATILRKHVLRNAAIPIATVSAVTITWLPGIGQRS